MNTLDKGATIANAPRVNELELLLLYHHRCQRCDDVMATLTYKYRSVRLADARHSCSDSLSLCLAAKLCVEVFVLLMIAPLGLSADR